MKDHGFGSWLRLDEVASAMGGLAAKAPRKGAHRRKRERCDKNLGHATRIRFLALLALSIDFGYCGRD